MQAVVDLVEGAQLRGGEERAAPDLVGGVELGGEEGGLAGGDVEGAEVFGLTNAKCPMEKTFLSEN